MNAIELKGLTKRYGNTVALDGVTLAVGEGRIVGLLGRNGAGKTTLLNIVANKLFASEGQALVFGMPAEENAEAQSRIFYMTEKNLYPPAMRVREAFRWAAEFYPDFDAAYAGELAKKFALDMEKKVRALSTGYASIFKLVMALASGAPILLFDEPVLGLDANHRALFYRELIARYAEKPCTVVISTHLIDEVADVLEEAVLIKRGKIMLHGPVEDIRRAACTVSGEAAAVDAFTAGRAVVAVETMGRFKAVTIHEALDDALIARAREQKLEVAPASLQKLFIDLTND